MSIMFLIFMYIMQDFIHYISNYTSENFIFLKCLTHGFEILDFLSLNVKLYHYFFN